MRVRSVNRSGDMPVRRGDVVVCLRTSDGWAGLHTSLRSVLEHTDPVVPILLWGARDADLDHPLIRGDPSPASAMDRELLLGSGATSKLVALTGPADLVLLDSDCEVAAEWLQALRQAAYSASEVAIASAIASGPLPPGWSFDGAAAVVRSRSLRLRPRVSAAGGRCTYIRRSGLELAGEIEVPRGSEELSALSRRCTDLGLSLVLADDVLVRHNGQDGYQPWQAADNSPGTLGRSLDRARRALTGLSVLVDARILIGPPTGTQIQIMEMIAALVHGGEVRLSALVSDQLGDEARRILSSLPDLKLVSDSQARTEGCGRADVVHRPYQLDNPGDLTFLHGLGQRLVITHQDLIGYHNPSYFRSQEEWLGYRELTRTALASADHVLFFSTHSRDGALNEELVEPDRATAVHLGVDHRIAGSVTAARPPAGVAGLDPETALVLCIGNDYLHKNRPFALRVLHELRSSHGWKGSLVLAGPHVAHGSSAEEERHILGRWPALKDGVVDLGVVNEPEKEWLLRRVGLVIYPTVYEGFGLVPFEAADHDVPCMWAAGTSLSELLGQVAGQIVPWDPKASAERALALLSDPTEREQNLKAIRTAAESLTWDEMATRLVGIYEATCDAPRAPAGSLQRRTGLTNKAFSEDAVRLVGPGGALSPDLERTLLALATHPRIGDPVFSALKFGYRASYRLRRWVRS